MRWAEARGFLRGFHAGIPRPWIFQGAHTCPLFSVSHLGQRWLPWWSLCRSGCSWSPSQGSSLASQTLTIRCFPSLKKNFKRPSPSLEPRTGTEGMKLMRAYTMILSNPCRIHPAPGTAVVVTMSSSLKALMGGCLTPSLLSGPLHSVSAPLANMFTVSVKRVADMVQPLIMPTSSWRQSDVSWPDESLKLNLP